MLPMPATNFWSMSRAFSFILRAVSRSPKWFHDITSSSGSHPRWRSSGTSCSSSSGVVTNISPKVRGSMKRSWPPWVKVMITWVCLSTPLRELFARRSWPLMPRCATSRSPPSSLNSRYLPLRFMAVIFWPSSRDVNWSLRVWRRIERLPLTSTALIFLPTTSRSRSRRRVSTSGSSGNGPTRVGVGVRDSARAGPLQRFPRHPGRRLLGLLLRAALARSVRAAADIAAGEEALVVVEALVVDLVTGHVVEAGGQLLEPALEVLPRPLGRLGDAFAQQADDEAVGLRPAPVEVDRGDQGLHDVGQDRGLLPPAGLVLALAEQQRRAHLELGGDLGQHDRVPDRGPHPRRLARGEVAVGPEDVVCDGQAEDGVAQELEALVRHRAGRLCAPRAVGDGPSEQVGILEAVSQSAAEGLELRGQARQDAPSLATT